MTNFRLFQPDRICSRQFYNENGRKFSKRVENTVGKGEIAHYEQFLLFPPCFGIEPRQKIDSIFNSLPDDKISDWSEWEQIADHILKCI